jgi:hypothetical protein
MKRPYFLWDYELTEADVRRILKTGTETDKIWLMSRILESATLEDVWKYTSLQEVKYMFPKLKLKKPIRKAWNYALSVWSGQ